MNRTRWMDVGWFFFLLFTYFLATESRTIWDEIELDDYALSEVLIQKGDDENEIPVGCYQKIGYSGFGHTFRFSQAVTDQFKPCFIELPAPSVIEFLDFNFQKNTTVARIVTGNTLRRFPLRSSPLNKDSEERTWRIECAYAYLVVHNRTWTDAITFKINYFSHHKLSFDIDSCNAWAPLNEFF